VDEGLLECSAGTKSSRVVLAALKVSMRFLITEVVLWRLPSRLGTIIIIIIIISCDLWVSRHLLKDTFPYCLRNSNWTKERSKPLELWSDGGPKFILSAFHLYISSEEQTEAISVGRVSMWAVSGVYGVVAASPRLFVVRRSQTEEQLKLWNKWYDAS